MESLETRPAEDLFRDELVRGGTGEDIARRTEELAQRETRHEVAQVLNRTAKDVRGSIKNMDTEILPAGIAGQAYQGTDEAVVDLTKTLTPGDESLINAGWAHNIYLHEGRHTVQAASHNAEAIEVDGEIVTWTEVSEYDAIEAQDAPDQISEGYKQIRSKVHRLLGSRAREVALSGDMASLALAA